MTIDDLSSGKGHKDENFPVASFVLKPEHRAVVMAFYRFARKADDIVDHPTASAEDKLERLERLRTTLSGADDLDSEALTLRQAQERRGLSARHGLDLLEAFRRDARQTRYRDYDALLDYCRYSAMPVGRFVLDVHGESEDLWPASDALCAALQIINHLQDCGKDYKALNRVYIPLDLLSAADVTVAALGESQASAPLRSVLKGLASRAQDLLGASKGFAPAIRSRRLAMEVATIQALAEDLALRLVRADPLSERVHHRPVEAALIAVAAAAGQLLVKRRRPS